MFYFVMPIKKDKEIPINGKVEKILKGRLGSIP